MLVVLSEWPSDVSDYPGGFAVVREVPRVLEPVVYGDEVVGGEQVVVDRFETERVGEEQGVGEQVVADQFDAERVGDQFATDSEVL